MNRLTEALASVCRNHALAEKWLVAPSLRVGHQWLEAVARSGQPALNVRVKTLEGLALELADPEIRREGVRLVDDLGATVFLDRTLQRLRAAQSLEYLQEVESTTGMLQALAGTCQELRLAGLEVDRLHDDHFEVSAKGRDLRRVLREYRTRLQNQQHIDTAGALKLAIHRVREGGRGAGLLLLLPADLVLRGLTKQLIEAFPADQRLVLAVDEPAAPGEVGVEPRPVLERLRWLLAPAQAPPRESGEAEAGADAPVQIFRAVGTINEVREVLRRCLARTIPLDHVELLHTDSATYIPAIYETFVAQHPDQGTAPGEQLPVTFAEGIPCRYSRPGRALAAWVAWTRSGYPEAEFGAMLREGLIEVPESRAGRRDMARLADRFRAAGVGFGRERYARKLREKLDRLLEAETLAQARELVNGDHEAEARARARNAADQRDLNLLLRLVEPVLEVSPGPEASPQDVIQAAHRFVERWARSADELDENARGRLLKDIKRLEEWLALESEPVSFDVWGWLERLPDEARVLGSAPRPGCLHVDHVSAGGHSGRAHTFIIGLDDGRFPGLGGQDPLLLDGERGRLSEALVTSSIRLEDGQRSFARLLARLRGHVTLGYSCCDLADGREQFPSPLVLAAFRLIEGKPDADLRALSDRLARPASFAPEQAEPCRDLGEWWLHKLCRAASPPERLALLDAHFPHLARGVRAEQARQGPSFTHYDGHVAAAGEVLDPTRPDGPVFSTKQLETLGRCPLAYFFEYGLRIEPPEGLEILPGQWLGNLEYGRLLHEVLSRFVRECIDAGRPIEGLADLPRLEQILDQAVRRYRDQYPPPGESAYLRQLAELQRAIRIFLVEEGHLRAELDCWPAFVEASLGARPDHEAGDQGTELDCQEPLPVRLPDGTTLRAQGRVDRIDRVHGRDSLRFAIWDYKTGSTTNYDPANPFRAGRRVQHTVYLAIVEQQLQARVDPRATVESFGFFFPSARASGERVQWSCEQLAEGNAILDRLCQVARAGAFSPTNDVKDCEYCDYRGVCGDVEALVAASKRKLEAADNAPLEPFRALRAPAEKPSRPRGRARS